MTLYTRFAKDISEELFNSVYSDLQAIATRQQSAIWHSIRNKAKAGYYVGEAQEAFTAFCKSKLSLGDALDFVKLARLYQGEAA